MKLSQFLQEAIRNRTLIKGQPLSGDYSHYIRSITELKDLLKEHYGNSKMTLDNIIKLYAEHDMKLTDNLLEFEFTVKELDKYKEWKRTRNDSNLSTDEWDEMKADIKKNGIRDYGVLGMYQKRNGDVLTYIGEGNHRLAIAKELGIKKMKMRLFYGKA